MINQKLELEKALPQRTNVMIGRTEIPKWSGQSYKVWKKEIEKWTANDKSTDEAKYCNILESLKENDTVKEYTMSQIVERTERLRTVKSILDIMDEKYLKTVGEKTLELMKNITEYKTDGTVEELIDNFGRMMTEVEKIELAQNLNYALTLQFVDKLERDGKIKKEERYRLKDEMETKEGRPKIGNVAENVRKELRRMRVLDNREDMWKSTTHNTHYVQR